MLLLGCDTTSKIGTKSSALKVASDESFSKLVDFGKREINEEMITLAEKFLVKCVCKDEFTTTFNQLRSKVFYKKYKHLDLEKLPPTSSSIRFHIKRAYIQAHVWLHSYFVESIEIDPVEYGYERDETEELLIPIITPELTVPEELPMPCKCIKCARETVCVCRINAVKCCQYCNCQSKDCKNPLV